MTPPKKQQQTKKKNIQKTKKKLAENKTFTDRIFSFPIAHLIIVALVFVLYFQAFNFELGRLDEDLIIVKHAKYLSDFGNITDSFSRDAFYGIKTAEFYRPLQNMSYFFDFALSGTKGWGYSLINMLIHILTCITIYELLKAIKIKVRLSFLMTLFYAAAPLFVQAITWAPGRGDLLLGLFGSLSLLMLIKFFQTGNLKFIILNLISFLLAVLSKESGVALSALYLVVWWFYTKQSNQKNNFLYFFPLHLFVVIIYLVLRNQMVLSGLSAKTFGFGSFIGNLATIPEYLSKLILPNNLCPFPYYSAVTTVIGLLLMATLLFLLIKYKNYKDKNAVIAIMLFLTSVVPGMFYTHQYGAYAYSYLEHRAYLPSIGIIILLALILNNDKFKNFSKKIEAIILIAVIAFSVYTIYYEQNYKDPIVYYNYAIEQNPHSAIAYNNLGNFFLEENKDKEAAPYIQKAIEIFPRYAEALNNLGMYYGKSNRLDTAMKLINEAIEINPDYPNAFNNRGIAECLTGNFKTALVDFNHALQINPFFVDSYYNRGNARHALGDKTGACTDWQRAYELGSQGALEAMNKYCK